MPGNTNITSNSNHQDPSISVAKPSLFAQEVINSALASNSVSSSLPKKAISQNFPTPPLSKSNGNSPSYFHPTRVVSKSIVSELTSEQLEHIKENPKVSVETNKSKTSVFAYLIVIILLILITLGIGLLFYLLKPL
jgi:hypothetical protein